MNASVTVRVFVPVRTMLSSPLRSVLWPVCKPRSLARAASARYTRDLTEIVILAPGNSEFQSHQAVSKQQGSSC